MNNKIIDRINTIMQWIEEDGGIHLVHSHIIPDEEYTENNYQSDKQKLAIFYYDMISNPQSTFPTLNMRDDRLPIAINKVNTGKGHAPIEPTHENWATPEDFGLPGATSEFYNRIESEKILYSIKKREYDKSIEKWNADKRPEESFIYEPIY